MKLNKLLLFISIVATTMSLTACDPAEAMDPTNKCTWIIENCTNQEIIINSELSADTRERKLQPNEAYEFTRGGIKKGNPVYFEFIYDYDNYNYIVEAKTSDGETVLKVWKKSERNDPGRQFFNEKFWTKEESQDGRCRIHVWTFKLLPEDLVIPEDTE